MHNQFRGQIMIKTIFPMKIE